jgi:photosystem II stability/assembly factor-like uncharacterized protein
MSEPLAYNSLDGSVWVFPDGPNHEGYYLGCTEADDITEPKGDITLSHCFNAKGQFQVVGRKRGIPGPVTTTLHTLTYRQRNYLEKIRCEYGLMFLQNDGGRSDLFCNHQRALILDGVNNTSKTYANLVKREASDDTIHSFTVAANNPVIDVAEVEGNRKSIAETHDLNDVQMLKGNCDPCLEGVAVADAVGGIYSFSQVWLTHDGGQSWVQTPTGPFFAVQDLISGTLLDYCNGVRRILVCEAPPAGAQGHVAYSDDGGATWTEAHVGGATEGAGGKIFAIDSRHIWLASTGGYIYFSSDGGVTWTAQEAHVITVDPYALIRFASDGLHGYAINQDGFVAKTTDGGTSWVLVTVIVGAPDLSALAVLDDDYLWVGDVNGALWFSYDAGVTWTQRTGLSINIVQAIDFANDWVGYLAGYDTASATAFIFRTIDGGLTWDKITSDTNSGVAALVACDENYGVYGGAAHAGTAFAGVIEE